SVCWSPDGKRLASTSWDRLVGGSVRVWDVPRGQLVCTLKGHTGAILTVCWSPDGTRLASAGGRIDPQGNPIPGSDTRVWDAASGKEVFSVRGYNACWSPEGKWLASTTDNVKTGELKVWDARDGKEVLTLGGHNGATSRVCWSPDGRRLA